MSSNGNYGVECTRRQNKKKNNKDFYIFKQRWYINLLIRDWPENLWQWWIFWFLLFMVISISKKTTQKKKIDFWERFSEKKNKFYENAQMSVEHRFSHFFIYFFSSFIATYFIWWHIYNKIEFSTCHLIVLIGFFVSHSVYHFVRKIKREKKKQT